MYIIERIEENIAVIEDGEKHLELPREMLEETAREGDVIVRDGMIYRTDKLKTSTRRAELAALRERLRSEKNG